MKPAIVIAGTHSGVGKTTISTALMAAYRRRGLRVQGFKVGPDFIDPGLHTIATGRPSRNLDGWMLNRNINQRIFLDALANADVAIVEGVMGLFDGASATDESGSTAEMAKWLSAPVLLVIDVSAQARSAAAVVHGFETFDPGIEIRAVIANRAAGAGHYSYIKDAIRQFCKAEPIGYLSEEPKIKLPSRHLGLVTATESIDRGFLDLLANWIEERIDLDRLLELSAYLPTEPIEIGDQRQTEVCRTSPTRIGVARDNAFCFYYQENLDLLESLGAELVYWSPINEPVPRYLHGLYFGGGYPELYAAHLAANQTSKASLRSFVANGGAVYAECGGLMFLTEAIVDLDGTEHQMTGVIPTKARMQKGLAALGYTEVGGNDCDLLPQGKTARGHQFRYSNIDPVPDSATRNYNIASWHEQSDSEGYRVKNCLASYVHLHFLSNPDFARRWLDLCSSTGVLT